MNTASELTRQREVVRASLEIPGAQIQATAAAALKLVYEQATAYVGPMPVDSATAWRAWRNRLDAFQWLVFKRLYRSTGVP